MGLLNSRMSSSFITVLVILAAILIVWASSSQVFRADEKAEMSLRRRSTGLARRSRRARPPTYGGPCSSERGVGTDASRIAGQTHLTLHNLIAASPLAIWAFQADGTVRQKNPAAETLFAGSSEPETLMNLFARASHGETIASVEMMVRKRDGTVVALHVWASPMLAGP